MLLWIGMLNRLVNNEYECPADIKSISRALDIPAQYIQSKIEQA